MADVSFSSVAAKRGVPCSITCTPRFEDIAAWGRCTEPGICNGGEEEVRRRARDGGARSPRRARDEVRCSELIISPERSGSGGNTSVGFLSLALWLKALVRDGRSRGVRSESVRARAGEPTYAVGYMPRPASDLPHAQPSSSSSSGGQGSTVMGSLHNMHRAHGIKLGIELDWSALGMHAVCSRNDTHYTRRAAYGATCRVFDGTHPTVICSAFSSCAAPPPANHVPVVHSTRDVTGCTNSEWLI